MDAILSTLKNSLNLAEDKYTRQPGPNIESKMMNYFLRTKDKEDLAGLVAYDDKDLNSDDEDDSSEEGDLEDDMLSDDEETINNNDTEVDDVRCGTVLEKTWLKRSQALRHDVAISAWMCSPIAEVMADCKENHTGEHRLAVTRLLRRWFTPTKKTVSTYYEKILFFRNIKRQLTLLFFSRQKILMLRQNTMMRLSAN
jgi:hypothetical protein